MNTSDPKLSAKDICAIIKECKNAEVLNFEYSGLKLDFTVKIPETKEMPPEKVEYSERAPTIEQSREEILNDAILANPALYEQLIEEEEIKNG